MKYPLGFHYPHSKWWVAHLAAEGIATLVPKRRVAVQAGGCAGLWPLKLAEHFEHVYTFEPSLENFQCLRQNIEGHDNITAFNLALGDASRRVGLTRPKPTAGLWQVVEGDDCEMVALDDVLTDVVVDAIVLDVEGSELAALHGAERLIAAHRPLLWLEFLQNPTALTTWLHEHGYIPPRRGLGGDGFSVPIERVSVGGG